jgi:Predicted metalloendopeptidase
MNIKKVLGYTIPPVVSLLIGAAFGYQYAKRELEDEYEDMLVEEVMRLRESYKLKYKKDEYETPEKAEKALADRRLQQRRDEAVETFTGKRSGQQIPVRTARPTEDLSERDLQEIAASLAEEEGYIQGDHGEELDVEPGLFDRQKPYIISVEAFLHENMNDFDRPTYTYYSDDDVLADEDGSPIEDIDEMVGRENLDKFGHMSKDPDLLYIRNHLQQKDIELRIVRNSYANLIKGAVDDDRPPRHIRRAA